MKRLGRVPIFRPISWPILSISIFLVILSTIQALLPTAAYSITGSKVGFESSAYRENVSSGDTPNKYVLDAKLNYERASLEVKETATYTNMTLKTLDSVVFNVTPAHFKAFSLKEATIDEMPVQAKIDGVVMELPLPKLLEPRREAQVQLTFTLDVPKQGGRFGVDQGILALGNWYPVFAAYRDGWDRHQYQDFGDPFFTEFGDYDVTLTVSSDVKVAHSGDLVSQDRNTWRMQGEKLRDFSLAISNKYEARTVEVNGVTVTAFYLPQSKAVGSLYLDVAERAVKWYDDKLGLYPSKTLHVAEVGSSGSGMVGQEYPGVVFIASSLNDTTGGTGSYLAYALAHEIAHQWFYAQVGNDQTKDAWMAEAMATFLAYRVIGWPALTLKSPAVIAAGSNPVNPSIYDFEDESTYVAAVYGKGAVFLQDLSAAMTDESFYQMLRAYLEIYRRKIARPQDFLSLAQSFSKTNLNPIIKKYFAYPEYKVNSSPSLRVEWPIPDSWQGAVEIPFESDNAMRQAIADIDGQALFRQDSPSSPLTVDVSQLMAGEYVAHVAIRDDNGGFAEQAHRVTIIPLQPTPTVVPQAPAQTETQPSTPIDTNVETNLVNVDSDTVGKLIESVGEVDAARYVLYGVALVVGLAALVIFAFAVMYARRSSTKLEYPIRVKKKK